MTGATRLVAVFDWLVFKLSGASVRIFMGAGAVGAAGVAGVAGVAGAGVAAAAAGADVDLGADGFF